MSNQPDRVIEGASSQAGRLIQREWQHSAEGKRLGKRVVILSLGEDTENFFDLIPESQPCMCGSIQQKEFRFYELKGRALDVEVDWMPGYGCTKCPLKAVDREMILSFYKTARNYFQIVGNSEIVKTLNYNIRVLSRSTAQIVFG